MTLTNYREISKGGPDVQAGFQFEFSCGNCSRTWKSPFKPYRKGQFAGLIYKFAYFLGDRGNISRASDAVAGVGSKKARDAALQDALELAEERYAECRDCKKIVCEDCWNPREQACEQCTTKGGSSRSGGGGSGTNAGGSGDVKCSNCGAASGGGRFCAECGFDMASTHKSCPNCGVMCARATRFCTDCGHGF